MDEPAVIEEPTEADAPPPPPPRRIASRETQARMLANIVPNMSGANLVARRLEVALRMAIDEAGSQKQDKRDDQQPGEGQVPPAGGGEIVGRWYGRPAWHRSSMKRQPRMVEIRSVLTPVEMRMGVEDHQPRHQNDEHGQRI